ncbi:MAG: transglycosylase SLT domain-containing protein, partial [Gemmatimonadales bacterium]
IDTGSAQGVFLNGERVQGHRLRAGDSIRFGGADAPEATVEIVVDPGYDQAKDAAEITRTLKAISRETAAIKVVTAAAHRVAEERAKAGGTRSRKTMEVMANTLQELSEVVKKSSQKKWVKVVMGVSAAALVVIVVLGTVIYIQHRQIAELLDAKGHFDQQIQTLQAQMQTERDSIRLADLERQLLEATANAERTLADIARKDAEKAAAVADQGDELDREIAAILKQFDAGTYAVPPIFKERLQYHIDRMVKAEANTRLIYRRKVKYWPIITKQFAAIGLPDVMGYVAWTESQFDPQAKSAVGAKGMWQMTPATARSLGLRVDDAVDERLDPARQTHAAGRYLANLLAEFGEDAFMLAMASYNRGENGVRRVLHRIAQTPGGFKKEKRDFWHLYRMKLLPEETREYVPKILAAAVICSNPQRYGLEPAAQGTK